MMELNPVFRHEHTVQKAKACCALLQEPLDVRQANDPMQTACYVISCTLSYNVFHHRE